MIILRYRVHANTMEGRNMEGSYELAPTIASRQTVSVFQGSFFVFLGGIIVTCDLLIISLIMEIKFGKNVGFWMKRWQLELGSSWKKFSIFTWI